MSGVGPEEKIDDGTERGKARYGLTELCPAAVFCSLRVKLQVRLLEWLEDERSLWRLGHLRTSTEIVMKNAICQHRAQDVTSGGRKKCPRTPQWNIRSTAARTVLRGSATSNLPSSNVGVERAMRHITMSLISGG